MSEGLKEVLSKFCVSEGFTKSVEVIEGGFNFLKEQDTKAEGSMLDYINDITHVLDGKITEEQKFFMGLGMVIQLLSENLEVKRNEVE